MYAGNISILNMRMNPEELKIATAANTRDVTQYFESIYTLT
jgi:hypothetical protein